MDEHLKQLLLLGREHFQKGEYVEAEYSLRQIMTDADRFADVHHMLGVIAYTKGEFVEAEAHFERAVAINPHYTEALLNLMVTYNDLGKYDEARRIYAGIRTREAQEPSGLDPFARGRIANMHAEIAQAYLDAGLVLEAIRELEKAVTLSGFVDLRARLGVLYRDTGQIERAKEEFEAAKRTKPGYLPARLSLAVLLLSQGDCEVAIRELEQALEFEPENKSTQMYLKIARTKLDSLRPQSE